MLTQALEFMRWQLVYGYISNPCRCGAPRTASDQISLADPLRKPRQVTVADKRIRHQVPTSKKHSCKIL